jgi:hypothetical protein
MTNDPKLLKQTIRYFKEENAELIKREARLERGIKEQENAINDLREQVFHLTKDKSSFGTVTLSPVVRLSTRQWRKNSNN